MSTRSNHLPVTGLAAVRNSRTRIYTPGADPRFRASPSDTAAKTFRLERVFPSRETANRVWRADLLDRLQTPLTRRPE